MLSRSAKSTFFFLAGPAMRLNASVYKFFRSARTVSNDRVHLGPGQEKYIPGWINVDANRFTGKCDVWADLRYPLPFFDSTLAAVYSHHMVEHLPDLSGHIADVYRCLAPGGVYRVAGPNGDAAIQKFVDRDASWFGDWPDSRSSIGGRFENFIFCRGEHLTILTASFLEELLRSCGFCDIHRCLPVRETMFPALFSECLATEAESDFDFPHTLVLEAVKPID